MTVELWYLSFLIIPVVIAIVGTRFVVGRRQSAELSNRLEVLLGAPRPSTPSSGGLLRPAEDLAQSKGRLSVLLARAGLPLSEADFLAVSGLAALMPFFLSLTFGLPFFVATVIALVLLFTPAAIVAGLAGKRRLAFQKQLPNAIDLMISVLKSGHSVPLAVRSVGNEIASPCGPEFADIFARMNLGQSLPEALNVSVNRWDSFELDLIARATSLQLEVGGSLSELLEKTNSTLRQRIRLKNQIEVVTSQARLSAWIVGLMPAVIALLFSTINPDYMRPLFETNIGRILLAAALACQVAGIMIMRRLTSLKV